VASSALAARIVALCRGYAAAVVVDIGIALEGRAPTELPEQCLGVLRLARVDMSKAEPLHDDIAAATAGAATAGAAVRDSGPVEASAAAASSDASTAADSGASNAHTEHSSSSGGVSSSALIAAAPTEG
jgi:Protein ENHANCED DISEASE RESISTANCE 2, C-terminal